MQQNRLPLSGAVLKNLAYLTMFIDHFFAAPFEGYLWQCYNAGRDLSVLLLVQQAGRSIGRVAFVLFAFLLAEGFAYTHNRRNYILRLGALAVLSEVPFDLLFMAAPLEFEHQNIFFTLMTGMLVLAAWEWGQKRIGELRRDAEALPGAKAGARVCLFRLAQVGALVIGCVAAYFLRCDYAHMGVLLIFTFYLLRGKPVAARVLPVACVLYFGNFSVSWFDNLLLWDHYYSAGELLRFTLGEMWGLAAFVPIALYNGTKGKQLPKSFYYAFYPLHLLLLYALMMLAFGTTFRVG